MKLKLNKSNIKNLSKNASLSQNATPAVVGGRGPILDTTPTKYLNTCPKQTLDWAYSCGLGDTCGPVA
ncbi:hypothetical protein ACSLBF_07180 [Pseudoalteromonas sp. T1lg65]|uniref:hypothetical protein n=1 Tax=Pseudoalteromonas sp. T1lg65 TaxID=2077101 RepID=UPI003F7ACD20